MSRRMNRVPSYRLHKASGQARLRSAADPFTSASTARRKATRPMLAKPALEPVDSPALKLQAAPGGDISVNEMVLRFLRHADTYYRWRGERTKE